ncbi:MAG: tetraacyldisaccharide 4'-kinase [Nitrospirae bacterium RBG_13_41_22]|nr:MAG: tetraacyldisaccharide 4'-kinase [Nitrospirae bacterium RBG_13_41_22]
MTIIEFLYYLGYSIKKHYTLKNQKRLPHKVLSIGNITLGGTGKTPATIALAKEAKKRGFKPCILTRGYRGVAKGPCFVSRGEGPLLDEYHAGDEALLEAEKLKEIPIIKGKDRYEAGIFALQNLKSRILNLKSQILFILDDGFQHWRLHRDKDILLIDSTNPFGNKKIVPLGPLREPLSALSRADIIVLTKTNIIRNQKSISNGLIEEIKQYNASVPIFFAEHKPSNFITPYGEIFPPERAEGKRFFGFCGIGNPMSFRETLLSTNVDLIGFKPYRDHYRYSPGDIRDIKKVAEKTGAEWIVTTEKDIMRLKGLELPENLVSLDIEFSVDERFYDEVFNR